MPKVFAYHDVKDQGHWLAATTREEFFTPLGITGVTEFVDPTNSSRVGVLMDVPDIDALAAALETPEAVAAEERDGVVRETLMVLVES